MFYSKSVFYFVGTYDIVSNARWCFMREIDGILFTGEKHYEFFKESLKKVRYTDEYHIALCYCLGICDETRTHIKDIYDFKSGFVKPECLHIGWQTGSSVKVVRMAFNLYCNGMPSVNDEMSIDEVISESRRYSAEDLFCDPYAPYFWQAIKLRYPEYTSCDNEPLSISY